MEGSTFEVPVFINTNNISIEEINLKINFDKNKFIIVDPSGGKSIISSWIKSPSFNNTEGSISYLGSVKEGIVTESGLVATITFKAINSGPGIISIDKSSKISLNDGIKSNATLDLGRAEYNILKKSSEGVSVFSETHPFENKWYNNNNPVLSWKSDIGVTGFSFILDNKPFTIPDNTIDSNENVKSFENLTDGLWYFHIKAIKNGAWGSTGHFIVKIDTVEPSPFTPSVNNFSASAILSSSTFISFFTTDNLSSIDHYEVGTLDKSQPISAAPVFIEVTSPFQVPVLENTTTKVIVRAFDKAGNTREGYTEITINHFTILGFMKNNSTSILLVIGIIIFLIYFLLKNKIINHIQHPNTFNILESDVKNYLSKRKEIQDRNILEKEAIEALEKELENAKIEIDKEIIK
ncbi:MAG: cohesin domain-containing protein [Candidatus Nomurabacteria bacterium]|nr:cohesin domain-containing protein [Candidatus Nomurabacteria bacterium]